MRRTDGRDGLCNRAGRREKAKETGRRQESSLITVPLLPLLTASGHEEEDSGEKGARLHGNIAFGQ